MIRYQIPQIWLNYRSEALLRELSDAKAAVLALKTLPYQREWVEALQHIQLKLEVAGTSRIEGADFTEAELDAALRENPEQLRTRSQRQAHAAMKAYHWIAAIPDDRPITTELIRELHRLIVTGADDDHCPAGRIRERDQNVHFGAPPRRGAEGGEECARAFTALSEAVQREFRDHDPLIQALALHYYFAAMHPFLDGNGRTARALEALMLQRAGLRATCFIPMSNYYYDEKPAYLAALAAVSAPNHDLTPFLLFGLRGVAAQCNRLLADIQTHMKKALCWNLAVDLFHRLETPRKRVIADRQLEILKLLLDGPMDLEQIERATAAGYASLSNPEKGLYRDLHSLIDLGAVRVDEDLRFQANLDWPTEITEAEFFEKIKNFPKARTHSFLR